MRRRRPALVRTPLLAVALTALVTGGLVPFAPSARAAGNVVSSCTETALRSAVAAGGTITFSCAGTITITSPLMIPAGTTIDGGNTIAISGNKATQLASVASGTVVIENISLVDGLATPKSGTDGTDGGDGTAGTAGTGGTMGVTSKFPGTDGTAGTAGTAGTDGTGGKSGTAAQGGALTIAKGSDVTLTNVSFAGNQAVGGNGGNGGQGGNGGFGGGGGGGGGVGDRTLAQGTGDGGPGTVGSFTQSGGAITGTSPSTGGASGKGLFLVDNAYGLQDGATGGNGGAGGAGGNGGTGGQGGSGGAAAGGAVYNAGTLTVTGSTFASNEAIGGYGGTGGQGGAGGEGGEGGSGGHSGQSNDGPLNAADPNKGGAAGTAGTPGNGGNGGTGGSATGGAIDNLGTLRVTGSTFTNNWAEAGIGSMGGTGGAAGQAVGGVPGGTDGGASRVAGTTGAAAEPATPGTPGRGGNGSLGVGGAIANSSTADIEATTFSGDQALGGIGGPGGGAAKGLNGEAGVDGPSYTSETGYTVDDTPGVMADGSPGGAGADGGDGGTGGTGAGGYGGGIDTTTGASTTIAGLSFSGEKAGGGDGGDGGDPGDAGSGATGGKGASVNDFYDFEPGDGGRGGDGGKGGDGGDGGNGGAALGGAIYGDAHLLGPKPDFDDSELTGGQEGNGSETAGKGGAAGKGGDGGVFAFSNVMPYDPMYKDHAPAPNGVQGPPGTAGSNGTPGDDGIQGSEGSDKDVYGVLTQTPVAVDVTLANLVPTAYGREVDAHVSVTTTSSVGAPPQGDRVVVSAVQGGTTKATCTATLPGTSSDYAVCALSGPLPVGTYAVTATLQGATSTGGDAGYVTTSSAPGTLTIQTVPTSTSFTQLAAVTLGRPATVGVSVRSTGGSDPNGQPVTITAAQGATTKASCVATLSTSSPAVGSCALPSTLALGDYTVTATYAGDGNYTGSTTTGTLTITDTTTVTPSVPSPTAISGSSVIYSAAVAAVSGTPAGTVSFSASNGTSSAQLCSTSTLTAGTASCTSSAAPLGSDTVTATFVGSNGLSPSRGTTSLTVELAPPAAPAGATASNGATGVDPNGKESAAVTGFSATGLGLGALTVATYSGNPTGTTLSNGTNTFFDVKAAAGSQLAAITVVDCALGTGGNFLSWYDGGTWKPFSEQTKDTPNAGCITAIVNTTTSPTLQQLTGTVVGASDKPTGDFSLGVDPSTQILSENSSVIYQVKPTTTDGFSDPVTLTVGGVPAGVNGFFLGSGSATTTVAPGATALLYLSSGQSFNTGTYSFTVTGTSGALTHTVQPSVKLSFGLVPKCYAELTGTVTDATTGKPVGGVNVFAGSPAPVTDASGHYDTGMTIELGQNLSSQQINVVVTGTGYYSATVSPYIGCGQTTTQDVVLTPRELSSVTGHVYVGKPDPSAPNDYTKVIATSTPVHDVRVSLDLNGSGSQSTTPDTNGRYEFDGVSLQSPDNSPANHTLQLTPNADTYWVQGPQSVQVSAGAPTVQDLVAVPVCTGTISVHAYSTDTGAVEAGLHVVTTDATGANDYATTDATGTATLTVALGPLNGPGSYLVGAFPTGTGVATSDSVSLSGCGATTTASVGVHVPVVNVGNVTVTALDATTHQPVQGATVLTSCPISTVPPLTDASGESTVTGVQIGQDAVTSGECAFSAGVAGYYNGRTTAVLFAGRTSTATVLLTPKLPGVISGTVTDAVTGKPIPNAQVGVGAAGAVTDADGHYAISDNALLSSNPPNGPLTQYVNASVTDGSYLPATKQVTITAGQPSVVDLALTRQCGPATVTGGVYNAVNDEPIPTAEVIEQVGGNLVHVDPQGQFSLQVAVYGNTPFHDQLEAAAAGFNPAYDNITLFCGAHVVANFGQSSTTTGAVSGTVTDRATGHPVAGAFVGASWGASTTTDSTGAYSFTGVPLGDANAAESWTVTVDPPTGSSLQPTVVPVTVPAAPPTTELDVALGTTPPPAVTAIDQTYSTPTKTTPLTVAAPGLLAGDTGTDLVVTASDVTSNAGSVTTAPDGSFVFTPNPYYGGTDPGSFTYTVTDAFGTSATGHATVDIGTVVPAPVANADSATASFETPLTVAAPGVLGNDTGTGLSVTGHTAPTHGTLSIGTTGGYTYTPAHGYAGGDSFTYTVTDSSGRTATATVSLTVSAPAKPVATADAFSTSYQTPVTVTAPGVLANDTGTRLGVTAHTAPSHGTLSIAGDGSFTYTPASEFSGSDSFTYTITDAVGATSTATVSLTVAGPGLPPAPVAKDASYSTDYGAPLTVLAPGLLGADTGTAPLTVSGNSDPGHGTVDVHTDGSFTYTPAEGFSGTDSFTYTITDADDQTSEPATVTVIVGAAPPPPPPPAPVVTALSPADGPEAGGTAVTVTGEHFTGATSVTIGTTVLAHAAAVRAHAVVPSFTVVSDTEITLVDPPGSGTVDVRVTTPAGESAAVRADRFTYDPAAPPPTTPPTTPPPTTTPPTTPTTAPPTTGTPSTRPTSTATVPATTTSPVVAPTTEPTLPFTGFDARSLLLYGAALVAVGALLRRRGRPKRRH